MRSTAVTKCRSSTEFFAQRHVGAIESRGGHERLMGGDPLGRGHGTDTETTVRLDAAAGPSTSVWTWPRTNASATASTSTATALLPAVVLQSVREL